MKILVNIFLRRALNSLFDFRFFSFYVLSKQGNEGVEKEIFYQLGEAQFSFLDRNLARHPGN